MGCDFFFFIVVFENGDREAGAAKKKETVKRNDWKTIFDFSLWHPQFTWIIGLWKELKSMLVLFFLPIFLFGLMFLFSFCSSISYFFLSYCKEMEHRISIWIHGSGLYHVHVHRPFNRLWSFNFTLCVTVIVVVVVVYADRLVGGWLIYGLIWLLMKLKWAKMKANHKRHAHIKQQTHTNNTLIKPFESTNGNDDDDDDNETTTLEQTLMLLRKISLINQCKKK